MLLTGSLEMSVFQTLSAGNIWHFGAPGTGGPFGTASSGTALCGTAVAPVAPTATGMLASRSGETRRRRPALRHGRAGEMGESAPSSEYRPARDGPLSRSCDAAAASLRSAFEEELR